MLWLYEAGMHIEQAATARTYRPVFLLNHGEGWGAMQRLPTHNGLHEHTQEH
ncbi:hypothetical protein [Hymenobacter sp. B1770]|uniref:hypothetical protein n=1 Tax=Hymenobacter sp. B1770 TaxID=1718788 RepID=UPI003CF5D9CA